MKKTILNITLLLAAMIFSSYVSGQSSSVWATIENVENLQKEEIFQNLVNDFGIEYEQALGSSKQEHLQKVYEFKCDCDEVDLYTSMHNVKSVKGIEYGPSYETLVEPDDYSLFTNYNTNPQLSSGWNLDLIDAIGAWQFSQEFGQQTIDIAISDQNYWAHPDNMHEELEGIVTYYDTTNTSSQGHGTAVAILAGGSTNNGTGLSSIGYGSTLSLYRMNYGEVLAASNNGARIINLSWTSGCNYNQYIQDAINEIYNNGTFIVASAGNGSTCGSPESLVYPAAFDNVFAVSSVGHNDSHERSNGQTHQHNSSVDIMAPGYDVPISAAPGWYLFGAGTSYASPQVAGTVSLMLSINPDLTNQEIETILSETAMNIDDINPNYIGKMGAGRLNAGYAVSQVKRNLDIENAQNDGNNGHGNDDDGIDEGNPGLFTPSKGDGNTVVRPSGPNGNANHAHKLMNDASNERIVIYPNPANQYFRIKWDNINMTTLYIYNSAFQVVQRHNLEELPQDRISLSILEPGSYVAIFLDDEENRYKRRIIIY